MDFNYYFEELYEIKGQTFRTMLVKEHKNPIKLPNQSEPIACLFYSIQLIDFILQ